MGWTTWDKFPRVKDLDSYFCPKLELVKLSQISWLGTCACMKLLHKQHTKKETKRKEGKEKERKKGRKKERKLESLTEKGSLKARDREGERARGWKREGGEGNHATLLRTPCVPYHGKTLRKR